MVEITPKELHEKIARGDDFTLIDVREPHELAIASIAGAVPVPLGTLPSRADELDPDAAYFWSPADYPASPTSREGFWPGQTTSIRPSPSTDSGIPSGCRVAPHNEFWRGSLDPEINVNCGNPCPEPPRLG